MFCFSETGSDQGLGKYVTQFSVMVFLINRLSEKEACKQNILGEIMLVKKALYPYLQSLREPHRNHLCY